MTKTFQVVGGDISDGYHTFGELYDHRCLLWINLCLQNYENAYWRPGYEGWPLLGLELHQGLQMTYHVPEKYLPIFKDVIPEGGPEWDGHTSADVLKMLETMAKLEARDIVALEYDAGPEARARRLLSIVKNKDRDEK